MFLGSGKYKNWLNMGFYDHPLASGESIIVLPLFQMITSKHAAAYRNAVLNVT